jgi:drug/metabolite transporter (DMT)-like permease
LFFLILSILCSAIIANLMIVFNKDKNNDILVIFLGNYFVATLFSLISNKTPFADVRTFEWIIGASAGVLFLINFLIYRKNIVLNGMSLSVSVMRMSLIIPIIVSVILFKDSVFFFNVFGIGIILLSFFLMKGLHSFKSIGWIIMLIFVTGISETAMKIYDEFGLPDQGLFVIILFSSAFITNLFVIIFKRRRFILKSFGQGMILGIPNMLTTLFFLKSLKSVPASIAFPLLASGVVIACVFADIVFWKKTFTLKQKMTFAMMIIGIILLNIK